jgi:hypothetical protein
LVFWTKKNLATLVLMDRAPLSPPVNNGAD